MKRVVSALVIFGLFGAFVCGLMLLHFGDSKKQQTHAATPVVINANDNGYCVLAIPDYATLNHADTRAWMGNATGNRGVAANTGNLPLKFCLTADINLQPQQLAAWSPIPLLATGNILCGEKTGGGRYAIDDMRISATGNNLGFFSNLNGIVQNIDFNRVSIAAGTNRGVIAGQVSGAASAKIINVHVNSGTVNGTTIGGLVGSVTNSGSLTQTMTSPRPAPENPNGTDYLYPNPGLEIRNSSNSSTIAGTSNAGGLIGAIASSVVNIERSYNLERVSTTNNYAGGLVAQANTSTKLAIRYCYNKGNVTANINNGGTLGGFIGVLNSSSHAEITYSFNTGDVIWNNAGNATGVGGFIGQVSSATGFIDRSFGSGRVGAGGGNFSSIEGIVGVGVSSLIIGPNNAYNAAAVDGGSSQPGGTTDPTELENQISDLEDIVHERRSFVVAVPQTLLAIDGYVIMPHPSNTPLRAREGEPYDFTITLATSHSASPFQIQVYDSDTNTLLETYTRPINYDSGTVFTIPGSHIASAIRIQIAPGTVTANKYNIVAPVRTINSEYWFGKGGSQGVDLNAQSVTHGSTQTFSIFIGTHYNQTAPVIQLWPGDMLRTGTRVGTTNEYTFSNIPVTRSWHGAQPTDPFNVMYTANTYSVTIPASNPTNGYEIVSGTVGTSTFQYGGTAPFTSFTVRFHWSHENYQVLKNGVPVTATTVTPSVIPAGGSQDHVFQLGTVTENVTYTITTTTRSHLVTQDTDPAYHQVGYTYTNFPPSVNHNQNYTFSVTLSQSHSNTQPTIIVNGTARIAVSSLSAITNPATQVVMVSNGLIRTITVPNVTGAITIGVRTEINKYSATFALANGTPANAITGLAWTAQGVAVPSVTTPASYPATYQNALTHGDNSFALTLTLDPKYHNANNLPTVTIPGATVVRSAPSSNTFTFTITMPAAGAQGNLTVTISAPINSYAVTINSTGGGVTGIWDAPAMASHGDTNYTFQFSIAGTNDPVWLQSHNFDIPDSGNYTFEKVSGGTLGIYQYKVINKTNPALGITGPVSITIQTEVHTYNIQYTIGNYDGVTMPTVVQHGNGFTFNIAVHSQYDLMQPEAYLAMPGAMGDYRIPLRTGTTYTYEVPASAVLNYIHTFTPEDDDDEPLLVIYIQTFANEYDVTLHDGAGFHTRNDSGKGILLNNAAKATDSVDGATYTLKVLILKHYELSGIPTVTSGNGEVVETVLPTPTNHALGKIYTFTVGNISGPLSFNIPIRLVEYPVTIITNGSHVQALRRTTTTINHLTTIYDFELELKPEFELTTYSITGDLASMQVSRVGDVYSCRITGFEWDNITSAGITVNTTTQDKMFRLRYSAVDPLSGLTSITAQQTAPGGSAAPATSGGNYIWDTLISITVNLRRDTDYNADFIITHMTINGTDINVDYDTTSRVFTYSFNLREITDISFNIIRAPSELFYITAPTDSGTGGYTFNGGETAWPSQPYTFTITLDPDHDRSSYTVAAYLTGEYETNPATATRIWTETKARGNLGRTLSHTIPSVPGHLTIVVSELSENTYEIDWTETGLGFGVDNFLADGIAVTKGDTTVKWRGTLSFRVNLISSYSAVPPTIKINGSILNFTTTAPFTAPLAGGIISYTKAGNAYTYTITAILDDLDIEVSASINKHTITLPQRGSDWTASYSTDSAQFGTRTVNEGTSIDIYITVPVSHNGTENPPSLNLVIANGSVTTWTRDTNSTLNPDGTRTYKFTISNIDDTYTVGATAYRNRYRLALATSETGFSYDSELKRLHTLDDLLYANRELEYDRVLDFTITLNADYSSSAPIIKNNGTIVPPTLVAGLKYSFSIQVRGNVSITVEYVTVNMHNIILPATTAQSGYRLLSDPANNHIGGSIPVAQRQANFVFIVEVSGSHNKSTPRLIIGGTPVTPTYRADGRYTITINAADIIRDITVTVHDITPNQYNVTIEGAAISVPDSQALVIPHVKTTETINSTPVTAVFYKFTVILASSHQPLSTVLATPPFTVPTGWTLASAAKGTADAEGNTPYTFILRLNNPDAAASDITITFATQIKTYTVTFNKTASGDETGRGNINGTLGFTEPVFTNSVVSGSAVEHGATISFTITVNWSHHFKEPTLKINNSVTPLRSIAPHADGRQQYSYTMTVTEVIDIIIETEANDYNITFPPLAGFTLDHSYGTINPKITDGSNFQFTIHMLASHHLTRPDINVTIGQRTLAATVNPSTGTAQTYIVTVAAATISNTRKEATDTINVVIGASENRYKVSWEITDLAAGDASQITFDGSTTDSNGIKTAELLHSAVSGNNKFRFTVTISPTLQQQRSVPTIQIWSVNASGGRIEVIETVRAIPEAAIVPGNREFVFTISNLRQDISLEVVMAPTYKAIFNPNFTGSTTQSITYAANEIFDNTLNYAGLYRPGWRITHWLTTPTDPCTGTCTCTPKLDSEWETFRMPQGGITFYAQWDYRAYEIETVGSYDIGRTSEFVYLNSRPNTNVTTLTAELALPEDVSGTLTWQAWGRIRLPGEVLGDFGEFRQFAERPSDTTSLDFTSHITESFLREFAEYEYDVDGKIISAKLTVQATFEAVVTRAVTANIEESPFGKVLIEITGGTRGRVERYATLSQEVVLLRPNETVVFHFETTESYFFANWSSNGVTWTSTPKTSSRQFTYDADNNARLWIRFESHDIALNFAFIDNLGNAKPELAGAVTGLENRTFKLNTKSGSQLMVLHATNLGEIMVGQTNYDLEGFIVTSGSSVLELEHEKGLHMLMVDVGFMKNYAPSGTIVITAQFVPMHTIKIQYAPGALPGHLIEAFVGDDTNQLARQTSTAGAVRTDSFLVAIDRTLTIVVTPNGRFAPSIEGLAEPILTNGQYFFYYDVKADSTLVMTFDQTFYNIIVEHRIGTEVRDTRSTAYTARLGSAFPIMPFEQPTSIIANDGSGYSFVGWFFGLSGGGAKPAIEGVHVDSFNGFLGFPVTEKFFTEFLGTSAGNTTSITLVAMYGEVSALIINIVNGRGVNGADILIEGASAPIEVRTSRMTFDTVEAGKKITITPIYDANFFNLNAENLNTAGKIELTMTGKREITLNFTPKELSFTSVGKASNAKLEVQVNGGTAQTTLKHGDTVTFSINTGPLHDVRGKLTLSNSAGKSIQIKNGQPIFIDNEWLSEWLGTDGVLNMNFEVRAKTGLGTPVIIGLGTTAVIVPLATILIVLYMIQLKKKKADYIRALQVQRQTGAGHQINDIMRQARGGN